MQFFYCFTILAIIVSGSDDVHPGDAFPTEESPLKSLTSEDLINGNEIIDPKIHKIPSSPKSLTHSIDFIDNEESSEDNIFSTPISTSIKSTLITKLHRVNVENTFNNDNLDEKPTSLLEDLSILSSTKLFSKKNLINIIRWKHEDPKTNQVRYWYEPEGGRMGTGWTLDKIIFQAYNKSESNTEPVYGFHAVVRSIWTNTLQMDPKAPLIANDQWISDGVYFYAYKTSLNSSELRPVYRYWNKLNSNATDNTEVRFTYLSMEKEDENDEIRAGWTFDDVLFYALPVKD